MFLSGEYLPIIWVIGTHRCQKFLIGQALIKPHTLLESTFNVSLKAIRQSMVIFQYMSNNIVFCSESTIMTFIKGQQSHFDSIFNGPGHQKNVSSCSCEKQDLPTERFLCGTISATKITGQSCTAQMVLANFKPTALNTHNKKQLLLFHPMCRQKSFIGSAGDCHSQCKRKSTSTEGPCNTNSRLW